MKNTLILSFLLFYGFVLYSSCATQQPVTGGEKDTIPPTLLETDPEHKSLNFNEDQISLLFDELIKENQIQTKLIITPDDQNKFDVLIKKNRITLTFEKPFADSTTYTLNFNSTIEDLTEGNDAQNVILAFSTTSYIDSLAISGQVLNLLSQQPIEEATVALYLATDTTDIFNKRPLYFTKTDKQGLFNIENLKNAAYRIYAFRDDNDNNLCEPNAEPHGFLADTLNLTHNVDSLQIPVTRNDIRQLAHLGSRTSGRYFESRYNKPLSNFNVYVADSIDRSGWTIHANRTEDGRGVVFYPLDNPTTDSLAIRLIAEDSAATQVTSDMYLKFESSKRTPPKFTYQIQPAKESEVLPKTTLKIQFNKPILTTTIIDSLKLSIDTLYVAPLTVDSLFWNEHRTYLQVQTTLDPLLVPKLRQELAAQQDSLSSDTSSAQYQQTLQLTTLLTRVNENAVNIKFHKGMFISVDQDSSYTENLPLRFINTEQKGLIRGSVQTSQPSFTIELIDSKYQTIMSQSNVKDFEFKNVNPGEYSFRVLIDDNQDGKWFAGNSVTRIEPEGVYIYPEFFNVRENWTMENIRITF